MTQASQAVVPARGRFFSLRWRLLLVFTLLFMTALAILFLWFDSFATNLAMNDLKSDLRASAIAAAAGIDGDMFQRLVQQGALDDADYLAISEFLRTVKRTNPKAAGMYTYIPAETDDAVLFVVSAALPPGVEASPIDAEIDAARPAGCSIPSNSRPEFKQRYSTADGMTPVMHQGLREPSIDDGTYLDEWGEWLSGFAPIRNSAGQTVGAVGVDMCAADIASLKANVRRITWIVFGLVFVLISLAVFYVAYRVTQPIIKLTNVADEIGRGNYDQPIEATSRMMHDEVDRLANVFGLMVDKVRERETTLKRQVAELQIIVDETKRKKQVEEIVESDFFRDLQAKARAARMRRDSGEAPATG